ncbi:MAG: GNAT family N-acetyltransferase [Elusimicrobia bacterium]|nr:GNAT family N-acetyltransferase [Elusimicrobiota bacterium]
MPEKPAEGQEKGPEGYVFDSPRGPEDWLAIRDICCRTAEGGKGVSVERREFFAEYWIRPYEKLAPAWTLVALHEGKVAGYLCGCPSTARFAVARHFLIRWPLFLKVCMGAYPDSPDAAAFARRFVGLRKDLGRRLAVKFLAGVFTLYPAHLHVNVDPEHQGKGLGKRLMELFALRLRQKGVAGLHLVCGDGPAGFYEKLGFADLASTTIDDKARLHAMGMILA